ncbi:siderophore biosynthesis protein SbnE [Marinithermofilum abyssi]|uniref:Siderophore biosynthesis protein SbnE n=1 Tax=Marinithermofilum abyssi TaxID=1571185 RepID=A0A8J2VE75_9BACL|nr:IucA/IucC family protein [Marinithermofilum abyssi]GGE06529.1 siderophore biosynthesis protein SbnE [Marinithermofilum abyssi]
MDTDTTQTLHSRAVAEQAAVRRLLNTYLRETGVSDPRVSPRDPVVQDLPGHVWKEARRWGEWMRVDLPSTGRVIFGMLHYLSPFGHHDYGIRFWLASSPGAAVQQLSPFPDVAKILLEELAQGEEDGDLARVRVESLLKQVENSIQKTARYLKEGKPVFSWEDLKPRVLTRQSEQSLLFGHPFHPTPKSSEGFSADDLALYAPELGADFRLHYFAVHPDRIKEEFLVDADLYPASVSEGARFRLGETAAHFQLLPCHPWQAEFLKKQSAFRQWMEAGDIMELGPLGEPVYPTSSVRTVCDPDHGLQWKLPINVRITNFVRVNPLEHLQRSLDASRVVMNRRTGWKFPDFHVLAETGYRTIQARTPEEEKLVESFSVLFREHPFVQKDAGAMVVASLLEERGRALEPAIIQALRNAGGEKGVPLSASLMQTWFRRYLDRFLKPVLAVWIHDGISLEAHVQNTMVHLEEGWPAGVYIRDMEGVSISRERAEELDFYGVLSERSPVLYSDEEAWSRLKYYVLTNHLGHVIHILAYYGQRDELELWSGVREALAEWKELHTERGSRYIRDLLENPALPAKANLISRFQERGERPSYIPVPNPIREVAR